MRQPIKKILGIETSCDETAAGLVDQDGRLLANVVASQSELHARFGGVVPEVASRQHLLSIQGVLRRALDESGTGWEDIDAVAVTNGPGLAGADFGQGRIWNGNWQIRWPAPKDPLGRQHLQATSDDFALDLELKPRKPAVIHGPDGVSRKSSEPGHASHYISFTRLAVSGKVRVGEETHSVSGSAWMDHEFFSDGLAADQVGWDWMSIQLENNTELMLYRLRRRDGTADPFSSGTYVDAGGRAQHLGAEDFVMEPGGVWRSPETAGRYPVQWKVSVPSLRIVLECRTDLTSQEIVSRRQVGPNYWEGAVSFEGLVGDEEIHGVGYLEMTGYDKPVALGPVETE